MWLRHFTPGYLPREIKAYAIIQNYTKTLIATLFTVAKNWEINVDQQVKEKQIVENPDNRMLLRNKRTPSKEKQHKFPDEMDDFCDFITRMRTLFAFSSRRSPRTKIT